MAPRPAMLLLSAVLFAGSSRVPAAESATQSAPPNFVIVVTDDQRWDTIGRCVDGFDGLDLAAGANACMPFLQQDLLARGVTFQRGYATTAFCCPSRASILTGRYAHHTGVLDNTGYPQFSDDEASTIATWLQGAGYRTGLVGKYLNGYGDPAKTPPNHVPSGWTSWHAVHASAPANYRSYTLLEADPGQDPTLVAYNDGASTSSAACANGNYYVTDLLCRKALDYLAADTTAPFFLYFALPSPHLPATPPRRWKGVYTGLPLPQYPNRNVAPAPDPPTWVPTSPLGPSALSLIDKQFRSMLEANRAVDDAVHALVEQLDADGRLDSTVFMLVSDNGFARAEHRFDDKGCEFEECHRIPFVMVCPNLVCPGSAAGTVDASHFALTIDIAPTIAELAGVTPATPVDGASLVPILSNPASPWRTSFLIEDYYPRLLHGVLATGDDGHSYKYVELGGGQEVELYDLTADPWELVNLANDGAHAETRAWLEDLLASFAPPVPPVSVHVSDFSFSPSVVTVAMGETVEWQFEGPSDHTVTDRTGIGLFDSGALGPGTFFSFDFHGAGTYRYTCQIHPEMTGRVDVIPEVAPSSGTVSTTFSVTWSSAVPGSGIVFDVQVRRPGSANFVDWLTGHTATSASFTPDAGPGIYNFRARLRSLAAGKATKYSPATAISVG